MTIYTDLIEAGQPTSSHYSDLYTPVNDVTTALLKKHGIRTAQTFKNQVEGGAWYDIAFAFDPYWEKKSWPTAP